MVEENIFLIKGLKVRMVEVIFNEFCLEWKEELWFKNMVYVFYWYDLNILFKKKFGFMLVNV